MTSHRHILLWLAIAAGLPGPLWGQEDDLKLGTAIVIDNDDEQHVTIRGKWISARSNAELRLGDDFLFAGGGVAGTSVAFEPELETEGQYAVFVRYVSMTGSSAKAAVTVYHADGKHDGTLDQRKHAGKWAELGRFRFEAGTDGYVRIDAGASKGVVTADGVMFRRLVTASELRPPKPRPKPVPKPDDPGETVEPLSSEQLRQRQHLAAMGSFDHWAGQARESFAPDLIGSETGQFYVYGNVGLEMMSFFAEKMAVVNNTLRATLDVPEDEPLWPAKMAVFIFASPHQIRQFSEKVLRTDPLERCFTSAITSADPSAPGWFGFVVMTIQPASWKPETITIENLTGVLAKLIATAHLSRPEGPNPLPSWLVQGLSEYIAAEAVPDSYINQQWMRHVRSALRRKYDIRRMLDEDLMKDPDTPVNLSGVAHGMVRFLCKSDPDAFAKYYGLLREGSEPEEAMKAAFEFDHDGFAKRWQDKALDMLSKP